MKVLVIGAQGQDGRILSELATNQGHQVVGLTRSELITGNSVAKINLDISDSNRVTDFLDYIQPDAIIHVAAVHAPAHKMKSHEEMFHEDMFKCHVIFTENILKWQVSKRSTKSVFALSSQMFTKDLNTQIITLQTPPNPLNYYGETKLQGWNLIKGFREKYQLHTSGAILFNHASKFSKPEFLFMHLATQISKIRSGEEDSIYLKNSSVKIDICDSYEVCEGILKIVESGCTNDFIFSSGQFVQIENIVRECLQDLGVDTSIEIISTESSVPLDPLIGDFSMAKAVLGWLPKKKASHILKDIVIDIEKTLNA